MLQSIPFKLLETMLYESDKDDIELWPYHLARLQKSIANFQLGVKLDFIKLRQAVDAKVKEFKSQESNLVYYSFYKDGQEVKKILRFRIRLLLSHDGTYEIQVANQEPMSNELGKLPTVNVKLDSAPIDKDSPYLYYKTTLRDVYNQSRERMGINKPENGLFDVILYNHNNEITETSIANLALEVETNGQKKFITPKLECGLLMGTKRAYLLENNKEFQEGVIGKEQLVEAVKDGKQLIGFNSVRGVFKMNLII